MILSNNGHVICNGSRLEIVQDFNCIVHSLMKDNPEIFIATSASWADIVLKYLPKCDNQKLDIVQMISDAYIELNLKENKDNE